MNKSIFVRALFFLIPWNMVMGILFYFIPWIDWSPFQDHSLALAYLYYFIVTYLFARWVFGRHVPSWVDAVVVSGVFLLLGAFIDTMLVLWRTGAGMREIRLNYNWYSLWIVCVYGVAVFLAAWRVRHKQKKAISEVSPA